MTHDIYYLNTNQCLKLYMLIYLGIHFMIWLLYYGVSVLGLSLSPIIDLAEVYLIVVNKSTKFDSASDQ